MDTKDEDSKDMTLKDWKLEQEGSIYSQRARGENSMRKWTLFNTNMQLGMIVLRISMKHDTRFQMWDSITHESQHG